MRTILKNAGMAVAFSGAVMAAGSAMADEAGKAAFIARAEKLIVDTSSENAKGVTGDVLAQNLAKAVSGFVAASFPEPYDLIYVLLVGAPAQGNIPAVPAFGGRLNDQQIADLANYLRGSLGVIGVQPITAEMVGTLRSTRNVPDYATQAASSFNCPVVGGEPGAYGAPDAQAVANLSAMMAGGERSIPVLVDAYRADDPKASPTVVVDALAAAFCPVVAKSDAPYYARVGELRRFILQVADDVFPRSLRGKVSTQPIVWAVPAGDSLVLREPATQTGALTCPTAETSGLPQDLAAAGAKILGTPAKLPVSGDAASKMAQTFMTDVPDAKLAYAANSLISAYCTIVSADKALGAEQQKEFVNAFGMQVIENLQMQQARAATQAAK